MAASLGRIGAGGRGPAAPAAGSPSGGTRTVWPAATRSPAFGAAAVDPDLAGAQQLLEPAMAEAGEMALEPAVEPDLGLVLVDRDGLYAAHRRRS